MILDASAVVAVQLGEPDAERFEELIATKACQMSSISFLEASIVLLCRRGEESLAALDSWMEAADIGIEGFTASQARIARNAYARFGKGRHPAALNFGDCASYALAVDRDDELLFTGTDFSRTDVKRALTSS